MSAAQRLQGHAGPFRGARCPLHGDDASYTLLNRPDGVIVDACTFDLDAAWPDGWIARPSMVAVHDAVGRTCLAHSIGKARTPLLTKLALSALFRDHGYPAEVMMDHGVAMDAGGDHELAVLGIPVVRSPAQGAAAMRIERGWRMLFDALAGRWAIGQPVPIAELREHVASLIGTAQGGRP